MQMRSFIAVLGGPDLVFEFVNSAHRAAFGDRDLIGRTRAEVFPELDHQGLADAPHKAFRTGEPIFVRDKSVRLDWSPAGQPLQRRLDISYEPMRDARGVVCGLFVQGRDVTTIGAHSLEERALAHGLDILSDTELLTLFLYHGTLDTDSADRAEHLLARFGTLRGVLSASIPSLQQLVPASPRRRSHDPQRSRSGLTDMSQRPFGPDENGGVAAISAVGAALACIAAAIAVDLGALALHARKVQGAADLGALAAAGRLDRAPTAAAATIALNLASVRAVETETGRYRPDPAITPDQRFEPGGADIDAARVTVTAKAPIYFSRCWDAMKCSSRAPQQRPRPRRRR